MDRFQEILNQLSTIIHVPLYLEKKRAVRFSIDQALHIQLEEEEAKQRILIAAFVAEIPPGKFRENLLREGLKANAIFPRTGTFAYAERNNQLALFDYMYFEYLTGEKFADRLALFIEKALLWRKNLEKGSLPTGTEPEPKADRAVFSS